MSIAGFGAINLDKIYKTERIVGGNEEGFCRLTEQIPGGSAANTLVGLARLGIKTGCIGKIGKDAEGRASLAAFKDEGVGTAGVMFSEGRSGVCQVYVDNNGQRAIYIDPGLNDELSLKEINLEYINRFDIVHMTSFVCKDSDTSLLAQKEIAKRVDADISFDPGFLYAKRGLGDFKIRKIVEKSKVVMPNENEIKLLTGEKNYIDGAETLLGMGVGIVAVKLGEQGCYLTDGKYRFTVPACKVKVVDTTGAGDAWNAGFLYGLEKGKDLEACGILGNKVAAFSIQKMGARGGLPREEMLLTARR